MFHFQFNLRLALQELPELSADQLLNGIYKELEQTGASYRVTRHVKFFGGNKPEGGAVISVSDLTQLDHPFQLGITGLEVWAHLNPDGASDTDPVLYCKPHGEVSFLSWAELRPVLDVKIQKDLGLSQLSESLEDLRDVAWNAVKNGLASTDLVLEFLELVRTVYTYACNDRSWIAEKLSRRILNFHIRFVHKIVQKYPSIGLRNLQIGCTNPLPLENMLKLMEDMKARFLQETNPTA